MPAQPIELGVLVRSLRRAGVAAPVLGSEILAVPAVVATARREADRLVLMLPWSGLEEDVSSASADALERPPLKTGRPRLAVRRQSDAAVQIWASAARSAGTTGGKPIAKAARSHPAATAVGPIRFDDAGDAIVPSYVPHVWRDGDWRVLRR